MIFRDDISVCKKEDLWYLDLICNKQASHIEGFYQAVVYVGKWKIVWI